jgi:hypothetical protein
MIKFVNGLRQDAGFLWVLNKTDRQSITEMFLQVSFNTNTHNLRPETWTMW